MCEDPKPCRQCGQRAVEQSRALNGHIEHWVCARNPNKCVDFFASALVQHRLPHEVLLSKTNVPT